MAKKIFKKNIIEGDSSNNYNIQQQLFPPGTGAGTAGGHDCTHVAAADGRGFIGLGDGFKCGAGPACEGGGRERQ